MRVLHVGKYYPPVMGGIESVTRDMVEGLAAKGVDVVCFVSSSSFKSSREVVKGVKIRRFGKLFRRFHPVNPLLPFSLFCSANKFDVVHVHMPNPWAELSCLVAKPKKLVVSYHCDIVDKRGGRLYLPFQKMLLRRADKIIVSSPVFKSRVLEKFRGKCVPIPYGFGASKFSRAKKRSFDGPVFLFVGRLVKYKGLSYLLEAFSKVDGTLLIVGNGPLLSELQNMAESLKIAGRVRFFTDVSDAELPSFYHSADVFVLPSVTRAEAYGVAQLEAMSFGKPVVSTCLGTSVEFVNQHNKTGLVVPPRDVAALASALDKLGKNKALRDRMGVYAKRRVEKEFSNSEMVEQLLSLYSGLSS